MTDMPPGTSGPVEAGSPPKLTSDFDFVVGPFNVWNRRLTTALAGCDTWEEFPATAVGRTYFNGAVSVDEMCFATKGCFGMSLRLFDPETREWTVYWVDSQTGSLHSPVRGRVDGGRPLVGDDSHGGIPIRASYRWSDITDRTAHWEQAFSDDGGTTWETNWIMDWSRRADDADTAQLPKPSDEFDFLAGDWRVDHQTLSTPLADGGAWSHSRGTASSRTYFNGGVSIDEFDFPARARRGLAVRLFNPQARIWSIYWVSSVDGRLQPPVHGGFDGAVGEFYGDEIHQEQPVRVRFIWSQITDRSAHWQQAFSTDGGNRWETNWVMQFTRTIAREGGALADEG